MAHGLVQLPGGYLRHFASFLFAFCEQANHLAIKGRNVIRFAAADPIFVTQHLSVFPDSSAVADIILDRGPARQQMAMD